MTNGNLREPRRSSLLSSLVTLHVSGDSTRLGEIGEIVIKPNTPESFWSRVKIGSVNECWLWLGATVGSRGGKLYYGRLPFRGRKIMAHRLAMVLSGIRVGRSLVCHRCDVPLCVNPKHLFLGTQKDNITDAVNKGRFAVGERHWGAKLTEEEVRAIRREVGSDYVRIAEKYGISRHQIRKIIRRHRWKHVV